jgi:hypothetical protein
MIPTILGLLRKVPVWAWLALAAAGIIGWQHIEIAHYRSKLASVQLQSAAYVAAQKTQLDTIAKLELSNRQWAAKSAADLAATKVYFDAAKEYSLQQQKQKEAAQHTIRVIYAHDSSARKWAADKPPAVVADSLRANSGSPN